MNYEKMLEDNANCNACIAIQVLIDEGEEFLCPHCKKNHTKSVATPTTSSTMS